MALYVKGRVVRISLTNPLTKQVLLVKSAKHGENLWELPGGKVKKNEKLLDAAKRELLEETGISRKKLRKVFYKERVTPYDAKIVWRHYIFVGNYQKEAVIIGEPEITDYQWCTVADALTLELDWWTREYFCHLANSS